ncbi:nuclear transport factor 2 family protein [Filimonas lacunae]|nr:nuclear transport factor 2 family protein [Filimonas lacunae]
MKKNKLLSHCLLLLIIAPGIPVIAQEKDAEIAAIIKQQDSLFWQAYNSCDTTAMASFFSDDAEFYHDKGGLTVGLPALKASFSAGMCKPDRTFHLRREEVAGTVKVFSLRKNNEIYGAIITGEHVFYLTEKGKNEYLDGHALFTHTWRRLNGKWLMTRVLSYDHGPATYVNKRVAVTVPDKILKTYEGSYAGAQNAITITAGSNVLNMKIGEKLFVLYAEKENLFFSKDRDLTFEFVKTGAVVIKVLVRERGEVVEVEERKVAAK